MTTDDEMRAAIESAVYADAPRGGTVSGYSVAQVIDAAMALVSPRLAEQEQARVALADALGEARGHTMAHLIGRARAWRDRADELAAQPDCACGTEERQT